MDKKYCNSCNLEKSFLDFNKHIRQKDGLQKECRLCNKRKRDERKAHGDTLTNVDKQCSLCGLFLDISEFHRGCGPDGKDYWCRTCKSERSKQTSQEQKKKYKETSIKKMNKRMKWLYDIKANTPCKDCGKFFEPYCMDFDHVSGDKVANVSFLVLHNYPEKTILTEIAKCELVCVHCHNTRTANRFAANKRTTKNTLKHERNPRIQTNRELIKQAKSVPCAICQQTFEAHNMQFDHIDANNKLKDVCQLKSASTEILAAEIAKCQVICAMCHRRKSFHQQRERNRLKSKEITQF